MSRSIAIVWNGGTTIGGYALDGQRRPAMTQAAGCFTVCIGDGLDAASLLEIAR